MQIHYGRAYFGRHCIRAANMASLRDKVKDREQRGWKMIGEVRQTYNGQYGCLMVKED